MRRGHLSTDVGAVREYVWINLNVTGSQDLEVREGVGAVLVT